MFGGKRELTVNEETMLVIIGQSQVRHEERNRHMQNEVMNAKSNLSTAHSTIARVIIDTFADETELSALMPSVLDRAFKGEL